MKYIVTLFFAAMMVFGSQAQSPIRNYKFTFKISNLNDSTDSAVYMANYYGGKQYYFDTAVFSPNGTVEFTGDSIVGGIYSIILEDRRNVFEFVVNEPVITMEATMGDFIKTMKVKTSEENTAFYSYLRFIDAKAQPAEALKKKIDASENDKEKETLRAELSKIDDEVVAYKKNFMAEHENLFISKVFAASEEPEVPTFDEIADEDERQRMRYLAFKRAYLQNIDFSDPRMLRTPILNNKLTYYITKLVPQVADSINKEADMLVARTNGNREMYKYVVHTITSKYEDSKIMGLEGVLVHMGLTYYCPDKAWWLSQKKLDEFCERVRKMEPLLIGKYAPDITLMDSTGDSTNGNWYRLYDITAPYTVLYFWDSGCGHCKKVTPKLKEFYAEYKDKGVEVYAVGTEFENKEWKKYIKKNELPWINVSDNPTINKQAYPLIENGVTTLQSLNFRDTYDIFSTPKVFILDKNKKIIATKLMPEQMGEFIDNLIEQEKKAGEGEAGEAQGGADAKKPSKKGKS